MYTINTKIQANYKLHTKPIKAKLIDNKFNCTSCF